MKTFKNHKLTQLGFVILTGALALLDPAVGHAAQSASPTDVRVVNTTALPVPTTVQGTVSTSIQGPVNVQGTVQVTASQALPVQGTVQVAAAQPLATTVQGPVQVTASQPLPTAVQGSVAVTSAQPLITTIQGTVPVRDVDNPARQPFQQRVAAIIHVNEYSGLGSFTVPPGKRLVIEHVSILGTLPNDNNLVLASIDTIINSDEASHYFALQLRGPTASSGSTSFWVASEQVRLYADPGTTVSVGVQASATVDAVAAQTSAGAFTITGHLVDVP